MLTPEELKTVLKLEHRLNHMGTGYDLVLKMPQDVLDRYSAQSFNKERIILSGNTVEELEKAKADIEALLEKAQTAPLPEPAELTQALIEDMAIRHAMDDHCDKCTTDPGLVWLEAA